MRFEIVGVPTVLEVGGWRLEVGNEKAKRRKQRENDGPGKRTAKNLK